MQRASAYQVVLCIVLGITILVDTNPITENESSNGVCTTASCKQVAQRIIDYMDPSVNPCDNFYKFACGGFIKSATIPPDQPGITSYSQIGDITAERIKTLLEEEPTKKDTKPFLTVKQFYKTCMDTSAIDKEGLEKLSLILKKLGGWPVLEGKEWKENDFDWKEITANLRGLGLFHKSFLTFVVDDDFKNSSLGILAVDQAQVEIQQEQFAEGLSNSLVQAYYKLMTSMAELFGADQEISKKDMLDALNFEIDIAKISVPYWNIRNLSSIVNPTTLDEMQKKYPSIPWFEFSNRHFGIKIEENERVNVLMPLYIPELVTLLQKTPKRVQANYAIWRAIKSVTPYLSEQILQKTLEFEKERFGIKDRKPRWEECINFVNDRFSTITGAMYIRKHFSPEKKQKVEEIVANVKKTFTQIVKDVDWMDEETRSHALLKIKNMAAHIGYADELLNDKIIEEYYSKLELNSGNFLQQVLNTTIFYLNKSNERLREVIPRLDWRVLSSPVYSEYYYNENHNAIEFPASTLQDIYYDKERPYYINYGSVGFLIGHVIGHGFDDKSKQYDENGNLYNWWSKETDDAYTKKAQCIVDQYSNITVPEVGFKINGFITQGENIADNVGVKEAYLAYQDWAKVNPTEPLLPGLKYTAKQLFWITTANLWCSKYTTEYLKLQTQTFSHSPNEYRVIVPLQNAEGFANDFGCSLGTPMNPAKKCLMW